VEEGGTIAKEMVLFVANFDEQTDEEDLRVLFSHYGEVMDVHIFRDRETEESLGYAFVEMVDHYDAKRAIKRLNLRFWNGRQLRVSERRPRRKHDDD
jgi:RNA recognition motif-containing protein